VYVVAQVKFSAVESIAKYVPAIQDELRKEYPRLLKGDVPTIRLTPTGPPDFSTVPRFEFQNKDRTCGIVLQPDALSIHVSRYGSFEEFCSILKRALDTVNASVGIGLIERIGLRFVDLVRPQSDETLANYLHSGLLGTDDSAVGVANALRMSIYQGETAAGTLRFRMAQRNDGGFLPMDIEPSSLAHVDYDVKPGLVVTLLDFDHFHEFTKEPLDFSTELVLRTLWRLHDNTDLAFRAAVTDHALEVWEKE
jgi:uncharacterized protein (TIGR04255 family)